MNKFILKLKRSAPVVLARREYWRIRGAHDFKKYDDYTYINKLYRKLGRELNLTDPKRYTEKLQWLKLFWRDDLAPICSDKYEVRKYLEDKGYAYLLNDLIAVYETVDDFDITALPERFVLKASHGSGWNLIVKDKSKVNWFWWKKIMRSWMNQNLYWFGREWNYQNQKPRIVVEKYLEDDSGELRDYKIICTNGTPKFLQVDENRATNHKRIYVDCTNGKPLDFEDDLANMDEMSFRFGDLQREMVRIAEDLCKPFTYVRVDFYECGGKIYFGELTFFGGSGFFSFSPDKADFILGDMIQLPAPNYNLELYKKIHNTTEKG